MDNEELVPVIVTFNKTELKFKFPRNTKVANIEEFLKKKNNIRPIEAVFLFEKKKKKLLSSGSNVGDLWWQGPISEKNPAPFEIVMRTSETYGTVL